MKIRCENCGVQHDLDPPAWVVSSGRAFRFRCASCGHSQSVTPVGSQTPSPAPSSEDHSDAFSAPRATLTPLPAPSSGTTTVDDVEALGDPVGQQPYLKQSGQVYVVQDWDTLRRWIREGRVDRDDLVSRGGVRWSPVHTWADLATAFAPQTQAATRRPSQEVWGDEDTDGVPLGLPPFDAAPVGLGLVPPSTLTPPPSPRVGTPPAPNPALDATLDSPSLDSPGGPDPAELETVPIPTLPPAPTRAAPTPEPALRIPSAPPPPTPNTLDEPEDDDDSVSPDHLTIPPPNFPSRVAPPTLSPDVGLEEATKRAESWGDQVFGSEAPLHERGITPSREADDFEGDWFGPKNGRRSVGSVVVLGLIGLLVVGGVWWSRQPSATPTAPTVVQAAPPPAARPVAAPQAAPPAAPPEPPAEVPTAPATPVAATPVAVAAAPPPAPAASPRAPEVAPPSTARTPPPRPTPAPTAPAPEAPAPPRGPSTAQLIERGWAAADSDPALAHEQFGLALKNAPSNKEAAYGYGYTLLKLGRQDEGRSWMCKARDGGPPDIQVEVEGTLGRIGLNCDAP